MTKYILPVFILIYTLISSYSNSQEDLLEKGTRAPGETSQEERPATVSDTVESESGGMARDEYIKNDGKGITGRVSLSYNMMPFELRDRKFADRIIRYMRDEALYAGAALYFKNFGVGSRIGVFDIKNPNHKKVEDFDVRANYFSRSFGIELYYRRYGRFYILNSPSGIGKQWNDSHSGSHMKFEWAGLNLFLFMKDPFTLNKNFSYNAAFEQTEKQTKSSGAFFWMLSGDYHHAYNNATIIPLYAPELYLHLKLYPLKGWLFGGFGFGVGFAYTFVLPDDFFISSSLSLMVRPMQKEFYTFLNTKREFRVDSLKGNGRIYVGYNSNSFFLGVSLLLNAILTPCYRFKAEMWSADLAVEFSSGVRL